MTDLRVTDHAVARFRERTGPMALCDADIRVVLERMLQPIAEMGANTYAVDGVTFCFKRQLGVCQVTTIFTAATRRPGRKVPRSELSRKEEHRRHRRMNKRWNR